MQVPTFRMLGAAALATAVALVPSAVQAADPLVGSARGIGASGLVTVSGSPAAVTLPGAGGNLNATAVSASVNLAGIGLLSGLTVNALQAHTEGAPSPPSGPYVQSSADVASLSLTMLNAIPILPAVTVLQAGAVHSQCQSLPGGVTGSTTIESLNFQATLAGVQAQVGSLAAIAPNTTIVAIPGVLELILNEQLPTPAGGLTVNAIHLRLLGGVSNVVVAQSVCGPTTNSPDPVVPEVPLSIMLPLSALGVVGLGHRQLRRRR